MRAFRGAVSFRLADRSLLAAVGSLAAVGVAGMLVLYLGNAGIAADRVTAILLGDYSQASAFEVFSVLSVRLPRLLCGILAGLALGVSGALFQRLTDNPLGSPDIIGFTSGAATGAVAALVVGGVGVATGALIGGVVAAVLIYVLAWRSGVDGLRLMLVGIGIAAVLSAVRNYLLSRAELSQAQAGYRWLVGGLAGRDWGDVAVIATGAVILIPLTALVQRPADRLAGGSELAIAQGLAVGPWRLALALVGTGWVAVAVVVAGPVGFVALAAPQVARLLTRRSGTNLVVSGLIGAALLTLSDVVASRALAPTQLPTGVVTGVLGGLYLLWLLQHRRMSATR